MKSQLAKLDSIRKAFLRDLSTGDVTQERLTTVCGYMAEALDNWLDEIQQRVKEALTVSNLRQRKAALLTLKHRRAALTYSEKLRTFSADPSTDQLLALRDSLSMLYYIKNIERY